MGIRRCKNRWLSGWGLALLVTAGAFAASDSADAAEPRERPARTQKSRSDAKTPRRIERAPRKDTARKPAAQTGKKSEQPDSERWISVYPADPR
jgi:hypothetical protein